jgi:hypothetical protein
MAKNDYSPYEELKKMMRHHTKYGTLNRIVGDWFNAISIIISVAIPALLLLKIYYSDAIQMRFDYYLVIISSIGLILVLVNNIYKFRQRSELNFQILNSCKELMRDYNTSDDMSDSQLAKGITDIAKKEIIEINVY